MFKPHGYKNPLVNWVLLFPSLLIFFIVIALIPRSVSANPVPYYRPPDYDSMWVSLAAGVPQSLMHNVGGEPGDYVVDLAFQPSGTYQSWRQSTNEGIGGDTWLDKGLNSQKESGGAYANLSDTDVKLQLFSNEASLNKLRIRIWKTAKADYDSGWVAISAGEILNLTHNLGGNADRYYVDLRFKDTAPQQGKGYHNIGLGGDTTSLAQGGTAATGAYWHDLDNTQVQIDRKAQDALISQVRLRIWKDQTPDRDSGWKNFTAGIESGYGFEGLGPFTDYVVAADSRFPSLNSKPTNAGQGQDSWNRGGIGTADGTGLQWNGLKSRECLVQRGITSPPTMEFRVRLFRSAAPRYDSGWVDMQAGGGDTLYHNIGGAPEDYWVDLQFRNNFFIPLFGINSWGMGGDIWTNLKTSANEQRGGAWHSSSAYSIKILRFINDAFIDQMRVRVWWAAPPDFDSGEVTINPGQILEFAPGLSNSSTEWLVQLQARDIDGGGFGWNNFFQCGDTHDVSGQGHSIGAFLHYIGGTPGAEVVQVRRFDHDTYADRIRVKVWATAGADFDKVFETLPHLTDTVWQHGLHRDAGTYVVDMRGKVENAQIHYLGMGGNFHKAHPDDPNQNLIGGYYWRLLNEENIRVWREANDGPTQEASVRIWSVDPVTSEDSVNHILGRAVLPQMTRLIQRADHSGDGAVNVGDVIQAVQAGYGIDK